MCIEPKCRTPLIYLIYRRYSGTGIATKGVMDSDFEKSLEVKEWPPTKYKVVVVDKESKVKVAEEIEIVRKKLIEEERPFETELN